MYGSRVLKNDKTHNSVFMAWHFLTHKTIPNNGLTWFLPQYDFPKSRFPVNLESVKNLPRPLGEQVKDWENNHGLFYPLNNVLVFDHFVEYERLKNSRLIVVAGSRMSKKTIEDILKCVYEGKILLSVPWLLPLEFRANMSYGSGRIIITEDFTEDLSYLLGESNKWSQQFGQYELEIKNPTGDGVSLEISVTKKREVVK